MNDEELIRDIAAKAFREALEARSQELAEDIAHRMQAALQPQSAPRERTKALRDGSVLIAGSRTQTETLEALLAASSAVTDGCGLLILRGSQAGGWSCHGLTAVDNFKRAVLDCSHGIVATAIASCTTAETRASELDPVFIARLRLDALAKVVLLPVLLKGRVAALLLALAPEGDEAAALEVLVQVAQLALDVQAYRKSAPKPAAEAHAEAHAPAAPEQQPQPVQASPTAPAAPEPANEPAAAVPAAEAVEPSPAVSAEAEPQTEAAAEKIESITVPAPEPVTEAAGEVSPEAQQPADLPVTHEPEAAPAPAIAPTVAEPEYAASSVPVIAQEVNPPAPEPVHAAPTYAAPAFHEAAPVAPRIAVPPDAAHEKARRFAKLLVEEIKLYNQTKVAEGRARGDLYLRLREDIEKSRAAYQKRYGESVRDVDYFTEELMRILADNNRSVMGAAFPG